MPGEKQPEAEGTEAMQTGEEATAQAGAKPKVAISKVVVHPLVLLSVVDHLNRMKKIGHDKRVVGVLLGGLKNNGILDVSNSFAVPFDEDQHDKSVWFFDHDYLENMYAMFKKVNARERIVGWYHTGPKLRSNDLLVNELMRKYNSQSVLVIVDVEKQDAGLPTEAYIAVDEVSADGSESRTTFANVPSEMGAEEAEEVGVEHLLRDIKTQQVGTLSYRVGEQLRGLAGLESRLREIARYLDDIIHQRLPINHQVVALVQDTLNCLSAMQSAIGLERAETVVDNDTHAVLYIASLVRAIVAMHDLINNKLQNRKLEKEKETEKDANAKDKDAKDKDSKDKDGKDKEKDKDAADKKAAAKK